MRTIFLGDMEAQYKLCLHELDQVLFPTVDQVVSLGNLISCSPQARDRAHQGRNELTLKFWEQIDLDKVSLAGAHEMLALNFPNEWTNSNSNAMLRDAWLGPKPTLLTAHVSQQRLLTHAGLTHGEWVSIGKPQEAEEAAQRLNEKYARSLAQGNCFALEGKPSWAASPLWADPVLELYPSWLLAPESCPFDQIHGGASLNDDRGREAGASPLNLLSYMDSLSYRRFGSIAMIRDAEFRAIDLTLPPKLLNSTPDDRSFYIETT